MPGEILGDLTTDKILRVPANQVADARPAQGATAFGYEITWPCRVEYLRAGPHLAQKPSWREAERGPTGNF